MPLQPNDTPILLAEALAKDTRIIEATQQILDVVKEYQQILTDIRPPDPSLETQYKENLKRFSELRGANLWFPYLGSGFGNGPLVELGDGSVKYDFIGGIGTHFFGHSDLELIKTSIEAAFGDIVMQGHLQQNFEAYALSRLLIETSKLPHCFLTTSGAMANENALKIAFQKQSPACRILAFENCFLGRTLATSQVSDKPNYREGLPQNIFVDYVPFFDEKNPEESTKKAIIVLEKYIKRFPKQHALMCFELVQGEGGIYPGDRDFFKAIMQVIKKHDIAVLVDEVQTFGRTPELFAFQYFELEPFVDIVTIGKLSYVCATLFTEAFKPKPGLLSQTFTASTAAIKASLLVIKKLTTSHLYGSGGRISHLFEYFSKNLHDLSLKYPDKIQGPFGIGAMIAFTPYQGEQQKVIEFLHRLFQAGVIGFLAGANPTRVRFLIPAGVLTESDIDEVLKIIEKTL